jgi:hypothetical protein
MATHVDDPEIVFPQGFDARREAEMSDKGYLSNVAVRFEDGSRFLVNFIDLVQLSQDLQAESESGTPYFAEPGLIVIPQVTREILRTAVVGLRRERFFESLRPIGEGPEDA